MIYGLSGREPKHMSSRAATSVTELRPPSFCSAAAPSLFARAQDGQRWRPLLLPAILFAASALALSVDGPLAEWLMQVQGPAALRKLCQLSEPFGHGAGVLLFALAVFQLDPVRRWAAPRLLIVSLGAGMLADVVKLTVVRVRPHHLQSQGCPAGAFGDWLPLMDAGSVGQSFPSGHVAAAVGLALGLSALYPRGRWLFALLAALVAGQRLQEGSHYLSDILFGAGLGALTAAVCLFIGPLPALFDRRESSWRSAFRRWSR
jgi:membrane-associated phospholipid phosphatase